MSDVNHAFCCIRHHRSCGDCTKQNKTQLLAQLDNIALLCRGVVTEEVFDFPLYEEVIGDWSTKLIGQNSREPKVILTPLSTRAKKLMVQGEVTHLLNLGFSEDDADFYSKLNFKHAKEEAVINAILYLTQHWEEATTVAHGDVRGFDAAKTISVSDTLKGMLLKMSSWRREAVKHFTDCWVAQWTCNTVDPTILNNVGIYLKR